MPKKLTTDIFIERARSMHNDKYDYSETEYTKRDNKVRIICYEHGVFEQRAQDHLQGHGCPECARLKRLDTTEFIARAEAIHKNNKYDYSRVDYVNVRTKVCIICPIHGEFWQTPQNHIYKKQGCPKCANKSVTTNEFIEKAQAIHGNKYDYSQTEYVNNKSKVKIICSEHGMFWQTPDDHLQGKGCPNCWTRKIDWKEILKNQNFNIILTNRFGVSKAEFDLLGELISIFGENDIQFQYKDMERYPFFCDFHIKSLDLFIEYNGFWTHGGHWFDESDAEDIKCLKEWQAKAKDSKFYKNAIYTWTDLDVRKKQQAQENGLNYIVLWSEKDAKQWINEHIRQTSILNK